MKASWLWGVGLMVGLLSPAFAADHTDGTTTSALPGNGDINDVYAWASSDGKINLAMTVFPGADTGSKFSDAVKYVFHTYSQSAYNPLSPPTKTATDIICTFKIDQTLSCWVSRGGQVVDYITGNASVATGITSTSTKVKAFAGLRNDPFFFNLAGFNRVTNIITKAGPQLGANGCISGFANSPSMSNFAELLSKDCTGTGDAQDFFAKPTDGSNNNCKNGDAASNIKNQGTTGNVLAIVLQIDKALLNPGGKVISVWGATTR